MTLGSKLQSLRESQNLSQKELAGLVGVSTGIIAEWEADDSTPGLTELSRLSKALGVSSDVLLNATAETTVTHPVQPTHETPPVVISVKRRKQTSLVISAIALCAVLLAAGVVLWLQGAFSFDFAKNTRKIEIADASVVTIFCYDYDGELAATGSGFVAFDGKTIITNYHVMTSAYTCKISTNQDISYEVSKILCYSKEHDIAVLQLSEDTGLQPLTSGDSSIIKKGETVVAIGSPLGIKNTVSTGVLSGRLIEDGMDVLQFTAPISNGSSGGALFDNKGNVIGITYASYIDGQNLNLAIPIELAIQLYENKGTPKNTSAIFDEQYPYIKILKKYEDAQQVSVVQLKKNPEQFDGKQILLQGIVCSDGEFFYIADKDYYSLNQYTSSHGEFDGNPYLYVIRGVECEYDPDKITVGEEVVVIGNFLYEAIGEEYAGVKNGKIVTLTRTENYAELRALLVFQPEK